MESTEDRRAQRVPYQADSKPSPPTEASCVPTSGIVPPASGWCAHGETEEEPRESLLLAQKLAWYQEVNCTSSSRESYKMLAVHLDKPGGPENLYLKEVDKPNPGEGEVFLKVAANTLNRIGLTSDSSPSARLIPQKCSSDQGPLCSKTLDGSSHSGPSVNQALPNPLAFSPVTPTVLYTPALGGLCFQSQPCTSPPSPPLLAQGFLTWIIATGDIQEGETVLIHASRRGVSTADIHFTRPFKAIPPEIMHSKENIQMAQNLGAAAGFDYKKEDFSEEALKAAQGMYVCVCVFEEEAVLILTPQLNCSSPTSSSFINFSSSFLFCISYLLLPNRLLGNLVA
nr:quinone oxidoreductase PIG3-like [Loxodonta africana]